MNAIKHLLVDASAVFFHYYFGMPDYWYSEDGEPSAAVYGFSSCVSRWLVEYHPVRVAVCFDESLQTGFRHEIDPNYKANRALPDDNIRFQLSACKKMCTLLGLPVFASQKYEADDLIASLVRTLRRSQTPIVMASRDKDLAQLLLRPQDCLWDFTNNKQLMAESVLGRWQVQPHQVADYLALVGDASDNIVGVPGVGAKTASQLLNTFESIDHLLKNLDDVSSLPIRGAKSLTGRLQEHRQSLLRARQLTRLGDTVPLIKTVGELNRKPIKRSAISPFCKTMGFAPLANRLLACESVVF